MQAATEGLSRNAPESDADASVSSVETHPIADDGGTERGDAPGDRDDASTAPAILPDSITESHDPVALRDAGYDPAEFGHDDRTDEDGHCDRRWIGHTSPRNDVDGSVAHCAAYSALCADYLLNHGPDTCEHGVPETTINAHGDEVAVRFEPADFGGGEGEMDTL